MQFNAIQIILVAVWAFIVGIDQFDFLESLYQPIVTGAVIGAILGDLQTGLVVGGTYQLMTIGNMPVGGAQPPNALIGRVQSALVLTVMSPILSSADKLAEKGDTKGIVRLNYFAMAMLGVLFAVVCVGGLLGGSALGTSLQEFSDKYKWFMNGLDAAGKMMRFVGFATLLRIMLSNDLWGFYLSGFALAVVIGSIEGTAGATLLLVAFVGFAIAFYDFQTRVAMRKNAGNGNGGGDEDGI